MSWLTEVMVFCMPLSVLVAVTSQVTQYLSLAALLPVGNEKLAWSAPGIFVFAPAAPSLRYHW